MSKIGKWTLVVLFAGALWVLGEWLRDDHERMTNYSPFVVVAFIFGGYAFQYKNREDRLEQEWDKLVEEQGELQEQYERRLMLPEEQRNEIVEERTLRELESIAHKIWLVNLLRETA